MKKQLYIRNLVTILVVACISVFYISCKKNANSIADKNSDQDVSKAKAWYEALYNNRLPGTTVASTGGAVENRDLSQLIKPDWTHSTVYKKFNSNVIEMSIDPSSTKLSSAIKNGTTNQIISNKEYSRSSYVFLNNGTNYQAYVMTLIADSSYVKNDPTKLANNTYKKRDADYSGLVLYFTPRGEYVNGYRYKNGKLINTKRKIPGGNVTNDMPVEGGCWYYYMIQYGPDGSAINYRYMYTICEPTGGNSSGGSGEGVPPPCPGQSPTGPTSVRGGNAVNSEPVEGGDPGDGGGFPAPTPCGVPVGPTKEQKLEEFAKKIDSSRLSPCISRVVGKLNYIDHLCMPNLVTLFSGDTPGYNWILVGRPGASNFNAATLTEYDTETKSVATIFYTDNFKGGSDLAVAKTILHESVHAYLVAYFSIDSLVASKTYSQLVDDFGKSKKLNDAQHNEMVNQFVGSIAGNLITYGKNQGYNLPDQFYYDLSWGGLQGTKAFTNLSLKVQKRINDVILSEQSGKDSEGKISAPKGKTSGGC